MTRARTRRRGVAALVAVAACAGRGAPPAPAPPPATAVAPDRTAVRTPTREPLLPPQAAMLMGLMPRRSVGIDEFLAANPTHDGRGVLIAILDSGIDAGLPGLASTSTGARKLLDLRDFSGEGEVALTPVAADGDAVDLPGGRLVGFGRVRGLALPPYFAGAIRERALGELPAADLNGDGDDADTMGFVVARASGGWVLFTDTDGDGSLANESPVHDFAVAAEHFAYGPVTLVANFAAVGGRPRLTLYFDTSGHGSHVAGIAAGHDLFRVRGFDGAAPGAQVLGLKIADNARGGVSVSGSMFHALEYAATFAAARALPLIVNLSFGIGNEDEGGVAVIDSLIDAFALDHPDVVIVISAGNDGPGVSTVGFPGSAEFALSTCALFPGVFAAPPQPGSRPPDDVLGWWSGRGGEHAKPDLCVPGVAFSNVPLWHTGEEVSGGTSMAAPLLSGMTALLQSALLGQGSPPATAFELRRALMATATSVPGATTIDQGAGVPHVAKAARWLRAGHRAGRFSVRALRDGANRGHTAAFRPDGLRDAGDTVQRFTVRSLVGQPFARLLLRSDAPWLRAPADLEFGGAPATVPVWYDARQLTAPGLYVGTVWARPETDTLAGAAFGLTNTVVVPQPLDAPYTLRKYLRSGRAEHLFLAVPDSAGGLDLRVTIRDPDQHASLYLFEPGGRPYRGGSALEVGGELGPDASILVRADDVVSGVYELVVAAPPTSGVTFDVRAALPGVTVTLDDATASIGTRGPDPVTAQVAATLIGAARRVNLRASGTAALRVPVTVPPWAHELVVDVRVSEALWTRLTDFALSIWDTAGRLVAQHPLNYAVSRQTVPVGSVGGVLEVELLPAFALADDSTRWEAEVGLALVASEPFAAHRSSDLRIVAGRPARVPLPVVTTAIPLPDGFEPLFEITARPDHGAPAARRGSPAAHGSGATR